MRRILPLLVLSLLATPVFAQTAPLPAADGSIAIINSTGQTTGTAVIHAATQGSVVDLTMQGLIPGWHAVQIHAVGDCSDQAAFLASGPIASLKGQHHGFMNQGGPMDGDLPNIWIANDGTGKMQAYDNLITAQQLTGPTGSAIIVRAEPDDYRTDPDGQAGVRVACGVISPKKAQTSPIATPISAVQSPPQVAE